jgi:hypothetical protein
MFASTTSTTFRWLMRASIKTRRKVRSSRSTAQEAPTLDGDPLTFAWNQTDGPLVELMNPLTASPSFAAPDVGANGAELAFKVTVDDGYGGVTSDEIRVNVQYVNRAPRANAGSDQLSSEGSLVT